MCAIDVGDEVKSQVFITVWLKSFGNHDGAAEMGSMVSQIQSYEVNWSYSQIGTTNTDVDDCLDLLASVALPFTASNLLGEDLHVLKNFIDALDYALAINSHLEVVRVPQGGVVNSSVFGEVDLVSREHVISELLEVGLLRQLHQERLCLIGQEVFREIEQNLSAIGLVLEDMGVL